MAFRSTAARFQQVITTAAKTPAKKSLADAKKMASFSKKNAPADWVQRSDHHLITIDMPGLSHEDFKITTDANEITIKTKERERVELEDDKWHAKERYVGAVVRKFEFPEGAKLSKEDVEAVFDNGVLTLKVPTDPEKPKETITIKPGN